MTSPVSIENRNDLRYVKIKYLTGNKTQTDYNRVL